MIDKVRCSKLARVMQCNGHLFMRDLKEETNDAAKAGTAAGEYLRSLLDGTTVGTHSSEGVFIDDDMKFYANFVADKILPLAATQIKCEHEIDWQSRSGITIAGHPDASFIGHDGKLHVHDLKYGWGLVEVLDNWQLLGYAIGEVIQRQLALDVVLTIHQPRPHHEDGPTRTWELKYTELLAYKERIDAKMDQLASGVSTLTTGAQCKYCPAAASACPAISKAFYRGVEVAHEFIQDDLDDAALSHQLDLIRRIEDVVEIKRKSLEQLAVMRMKEGHVIPGYISETSYGHRTWKKNLSPDVLLALTGKDLTEKVILSPAKAEKLGIKRDFIDAMTERPFLGNKLVAKNHGDVGDKIFGKEKPNNLKGE